MCECWGFLPWLEVRARVARIITILSRKTSIDTLSAHIELWMEKQHQKRKGCYTRATTSLLGSLKIMGEVARPYFTSCKERAHVEHKIGLPQ